MTELFLIRHAQAEGNRYRMMQGRWDGDVTPRGYKEINLRAMRLLNSGGILVTCSCSAYFDENTFYSMLTHAAMDSHRHVQILEKRGAGQDHPLLLGYPTSEYLKCAICRVM